MNKPRYAVIAPTELGTIICDTFYLYEEAWVWFNTWVTRMQAGECTAPRVDFVDMETDAILGTALYSIESKLGK